MKMPQEKNGKNTDLKCDHVLCRNMDSEKGGHHKIEAFEMNIWRRTEISWTEHISKTGRRRKILVNDNKIETTELDATYSERGVTSNWMRHIVRGESLQREIIKGRMEGKRGRGRPRQKLLDWMMSEEYSKLKEEAQHRETWNHWRSEPARGQRT